MESINQTSFKQKMDSYKRSPTSFIMFLLVMLSTIITVGILFSCCLYYDKGATKYNFRLI